jgi:FkbM family methyltransferase
MPVALASSFERLRRLYGWARSALIYHGNPWRRRRARRFYRQFVRPGDLCFDVGAHLGDRTGHFLALGARVVAVEPHPGAVAVLRRLYGRDPRVVLISAAAGAAPGEAELAVDPANPTVASVSSEWRTAVARDPAFAHVRWRERHPVKVTTLDALIAAHGLPAFCKIDVEGAEAAVVAGLSRPIPAVSLEYVRPALAGTVAAIRRLAGLGPYRFNRSTGESMRLDGPVWRSAAEIIGELEALPADHGSGDVYARIGGG